MCMCALLHTVQFNSSVITGTPQLVIVQGRVYVDKTIVYFGVLKELHKL